MTVQNSAFKFNHYDIFFKIIVHLYRVLRIYMLPFIDDHMED